MMLSRRKFLAFIPLVLVAPPVAAMRVRKPKHPTPRPGITAAHVLPDAKLVEKSAAPVYAMVREIPEVVDGIRCNCGCAELAGFYSLLSCYEQGGMAQHCVICQGQAKLAHKLHGEGFSLNAIRRAIDAEFGE
jgi:quinol-cytochrome oxidoreductase complex cytochrome b subunit